MCPVYLGMSARYVERVWSGTPQGHAWRISAACNNRAYTGNETFAPTAASAILLDTFFGFNDGQEKPLGLLLDVLKLYNDLKFRQTDELAKDLDSLDRNSEEYEQKKEYDATVANILNDLLRPK